MKATMKTKRLCVDYLKEKYKLDQISVIGLMIGARATFTQFFYIWTPLHFGIESKLTENIIVVNPIKNMNV